MKKNILLKSLIIAILFLTFQQSVFSQGVVISESSVATLDGSAMLQIDSDTQGVLIPRMSKANREAIAAVPGLLVYDITEGAFFLYSSSGWVDLSLAEIWTQNTDGVYLKDGTQNVGIGTETPTEALHIVDGNILLEGTGWVTVPGIDVGDSVIIAQDGDGYLDAAPCHDGLIGPYL